MAVSAISFKLKQKPPLSFRLQIDWEPFWSEALPMDKGAAFPFQSVFKFIYL